MKMKIFSTTVRARTTEYIRCRDLGEMPSLKKLESSVTIIIIVRSITYENSVKSLQTGSAMAKLLSSWER
ncbi:hypothetical protein I7I50_01587 [Histoplasma capsulatum G186AR]|nr:hypothetical protein I7I50_01587 [Histoplasma capsulatum G186AR]